MDEANKSKFVKEGGDKIKAYLKEYAEKNLPDPTAQLVFILGTELCIQKALVELVTLSKMFQGSAKQGLPTVQHIFRATADMLRDIDLIDIFEKMKKEEKDKQL